MGKGFVSAVGFLVAIPMLFAGGGRDRFAGEISVLPAGSKVVIDGRANEWDSGSGKLLSVSRTDVYKDYSARVSAMHDNEALYLLVEWQDATPLRNTSDPRKGQEGSRGGDCLDLTIETDRLASIQAWYYPEAGVPGVTLGFGPKGAQNRQTGTNVGGITQAFAKLERGGYVQEVRIPWKSLTTDGRMPDLSSPVRVAWDLWWDGLDTEKGYALWSEASKGTVQQHIQARFGGWIGFGLTDGVDVAARATAEQNPQEGALGTLEAKGGRDKEAPRIETIDGREVTRNTAISVLPAPSRVVFDGKLDEWDRTGGILVAYEPTLLGGRYGAMLHMLHDEKGLYVGIEWQEARPMFNVNRPDRFPWGYDGGGALQLRLLTDMVSTIEAWYSSAAKRPVLKQAVYPRWTYSDDDLEAKGASQAVALSPGGYTQEIFLPWALITKDGKPRRAGESIRWVADAWWSGVEGNRLTFVTNLKLKPATAVVELPGKSPREEYVTVAIDNEQGIRVRNLTACSQRAAGEPIGGWDGLDEEGNVVPPGRYTYKILSHTGIGWKYVMSSEAPGDPAWETGDGRGAWGGETSSPQGAATYGDQVFLSWPSSEKGFSLIGLTLEGKKQWGVKHSPADTNAGATALAADDKYVYYAGDAVSNNRDEWVVSYVACFDKKTGMRRGFSTFNKFNELQIWERRLARHAWWWEMEKEGFTPEGWGIHREIAGDPYKGCGANVAGLALRDGKLYVSFLQFNKIVIVDAKTGKQTGEFPIERPCGLAFDGAGKLLVVSGRQVISADVQTGATSPVITAGLEAPMGICIGEDGEIFVSDWGKAMCVKVFSPQGKKLRTIGKEGGRPTIGRFDPAGMLLPRQITIDKLGQLWVPEDDGLPRRMSVWDAKTGKFLRDYIGGSRSGEAHNTIVMDPKNGRRIISYYVEYEIDMDRKTYRPVSTLWRPTSLEAIPFLPRSGTAAPLRFIHKDGRAFVANGNPGMIAGYKDGRMYPLAAIGSVYHGSANQPRSAEDARYLPFFKWAGEGSGANADRRMHYSPKVFHDKPNGTVWSWADRNGDGLFDPDEMLFGEKGKGPSIIGNYWGFAVGNDLSFVAPEADKALWRFEPQGWTEVGAPIYDPNKAVRVVSQPAFSSTQMLDPEGNIITMVNEEQRRFRNIKPMMVCYSPAGQVLWTYAVTRGPEIGVVNGNTLLGPVKLPHDAGYMISSGQYHGHKMPLVTTDGLYIAPVLIDAQSAREPGPEVLMDEATQQMLQAPDGRVFVVNGMTWRSFLEITGLDSIRRAEGTVTFSAEDAAKAVEIKKAMQASGVGQRPKEVGIARAPEGLQIDGDLADWRPVPAIPIGPSAGERKGVVRAAYDAVNLYVAYEVTKPKGFQNSGADWQQLFTNGDCCDIFLGTKLPFRRSATEGDRRILFSQFDGKPTAVLYDAVVPGFKGEKVAFASGVGREAFDAVRQLGNAKVAIKDTKAGYVIEAAVPWSELGIKPAPGLRLLGDFGVVFADVTGRSRADRFRVFNPDPFVTDLPTEAKLATDKWGGIILK